MTIEIGRMFSGAGYPGFGQHLPEHHKLLPPSFPEPKGDQIDPLQNQLCRVCEEPAAGFHFGAFTCEGCKSFFGRTCNNQSVIQECKNNYRCVVDKKNRTACKACRLRKCLMVGMSKSGSRYGRRSNWFKIHFLMQQNLGKGGGSNPSAPSSIIPPPVTSMSHHSSPFGSSLPPTISWPPPHHHAAHHQLPLSSMLSGSSPLSSAHSPLTALASPLSSSHSPLSSPMKKEKSDCSSRSPSPLNVSTLSSPDGSLKSSPREIEKPAPRKLGDLSGLSPPSAGAGLPPPPTSLHNLYFPPPLPFLASNPFSFYRLSPLLATNPFLANSLYFSLASAAGQKSPPNDDSLTTPIIPPVSTADSTVSGSVMEYQKSFQEHLRYLEMLKEKEFGPSKPDGRTSPYLNVDQVKEELSPPSSPDLKSSADDSRAVSPPSLPLTSQLHKENLQILTESPASRRHFESATTADQQKLTVRHLELLREHQTLLKAYSGLPTRDILPTGEGGHAMDLSVAVKEKSD